MPAVVHQLAANKTRAVNSERPWSFVCMSAWKEVCALELLCQPPIKTSETPRSPQSTQTSNGWSSAPAAPFQISIPPPRAGNRGPANLSPS